MAQYIDKDALLAEIKKRMQELRPTNTHQIQVGEKMDRDVLMWLNALTWVKNLLDTIEVKEVDLEKELDFVKDAYYYFTSDERSSMKKVAKHFFELGMVVGNKAQKVE